MKWIKASERLPMHKAHWVTGKYGDHDNDFPVRMNGIYSMGNIYDECKIGDPPKMSIKFNGEDHFENEFSEIEWLDETPQPKEVFTREQFKEELRLLVWDAWKSAANAFRMYPENKHTFTDYWHDIGESRIDEYLKSKP